MRYPDFLKPNGTIGFVAPSFGCAGPFGDSFNLAEQKLAALGHGLTEGPNCRSGCGLGISATPEACGRELTECYCSEDSDVLISCGGGELMCRDLDYVDFDRVRAAKPKWFMGLSDNTNFSFLLTTLCDVASVYGPCASSFGMEPWHPAIQDAYDILTGKTARVSGYSGYQKSMFIEGAAPGDPYLITEPLSLKLIPEEKLEFSGRLIGGCLDVLANLVGTSFDQVPQFVEKYREDGIVWFLESCDLGVWSICRALWQLEHAGWFKYVKGFVIGRPLCNGQVDNGLDQYRAVMENLGKYQVPIVLDADLGHLPPSMPLICGSYAAVEADGNALTVKMTLK